MDRPTFAPSVVYRNPLAALKWLERAFGFEATLVVTDKDGNLGHSEMSFLGGVANLFNRKPPLVSTVGAPISTFGQVPLNGTYYDYLGRRVFMSVKTSLPNL